MTENNLVAHASDSMKHEQYKQLKELWEKPLEITENQNYVIEFYKIYMKRYFYSLVELEKSLTLFLKDYELVNQHVNFIKYLLWREKKMKVYINLKTSTNMRTYKDEFNKWVQKYNVELFEKLSDVVPDTETELTTGQEVVFINDYFVIFPGNTIMGFCKPELNDRTVYLDYDCYWFPSHIKNLFFDDKLVNNISLYKYNSLYILEIFRIKCVIQSYEKDSYVNLSPITTVIVSFEESLDNIRIDFLNKKIATEGRRSPKWLNFTSVLDIRVIKEILDKENIYK